MKKFLKFLLTIIVCYLVALSINTFVLDHIVVSGLSMSPTLANGEFGLADKVFFKLGNVNRFDIVVVEKFDEKIIKRVIALPNETISYDKGVLKINGEVVEESFLNYEEKMATTYESFCLTLNENEYFVMGDNRDNSFDSRNFGVVYKEEIRSRLFMITGSCQNDIACDANGNCDCQKSYHIPRIVS